MVVIEDRDFLRALFKDYGEHRVSEEEVKLCEMEVSGDSGRGLNITVHYNLRRLVILGWWPEYGARAAWPMWSAPFFRRGMSARDDEQLTQLVRTMLRKHNFIGENGRGLFEIENELDKVLAQIHFYGEAVNRHDWTAARKRWAALSRIHPLLVESMPDTVYVDAALKQNEELASRPALGGIH